MKKKKSDTKVAAIKHHGYESSESEGTKALNEQFEREPQTFVMIGSETYQKLPAIDQARIFLLQKNSNEQLGGSSVVQYTNKGLMKTYLKKSMNKLELNNPIALNNQVRIDEEQARLKAE